MAAHADQVARALEAVPPTGWPKFERARGELGTLRIQTTACRERLEGLRPEREQAAKARVAALADALRRNEKVPKTRTVEKVDVLIAEHEERLQALELAISKAAEELVALMLERRPEWLTGLDDDLVPALETYRRKIREMDQARESVLRIRALRNWLRDVETSPRYKTGTSALQGIRDASGGPVIWSRVLDALLADLESEQPKAAPHVMPVPDEPRPLRSKSAA
jgi:hypothetical protein